MRKVIGLVGLVCLLSVAVGVGVVTGLYIAADQQSRNPSAVVFPCKQHGIAHTVMIKDGLLSAVEIDGKLCDTLTITNEDDRLRLLAFGRHDHHQAYDGVVERVLAKGESLTITFDQLGRFLFHDHLQDEVHGDFTVTK